MRAVELICRSSQKEFDELRGDGGKLRENPQQRSSNGLPYMPYEQITGVKPKMGCQRNKTRSDIPCFIAGDSRFEHLLSYLIFNLF